MPTNNKDIAIRLSLKDHEVVRRALMTLGDDGQRALAKIEKASAPASRGLLAVNTVARDLRGGMEAFGARLGTVGTGLAALGPAGLAAAAGIAGMVAGAVKLKGMAEHAVELVAALQDEAQQAGVTAEAFQELKYAAGQYSVTQEALTDGLKELALRADEFVKTGKGAAEEAFRRLGFTQTELNGRLGDTSALFQEVVRRMEGLENRAAKIRVADEIFGGTGGEQFVRLIEAGAERIAELRREARDLGFVLDNELIARADETRDKLKTLSDVVDLQLSSALVDLGPVLVSVASGFADVARWVADVVDGFRDIETASTRGLQRRLEDIRAELADMFQQRGDAPEDLFDVSAWLGRRTTSELDAAIQAKYDEIQRINAILQRRAADASRRGGAGAAAGGAAAPDNVAERIKALQMERDGLRALAGVYALDAQAIRSVTVSRKIDTELARLKVAQNSDEARSIEHLIRMNESLRREIALRQKARALSPDLAYEDRLAEIEDIRRTGMVSEEDLARATEDAARRRLEASRDASAGIQLAMMDISDASGDAAKQWREDINGMNQTARKAFVDIVTGAGTMRDGLNAILNDLGGRLAGRVYDRTVGVVFDTALDAFFGADHTGGTVGRETMHRAVNPMVFAGAPRMHGGGLLPGERPIIARDGEGVFTPRQMDNADRILSAALSRPPVEVHVHNNADGAEARVQETRGADGAFRLDVFVDTIEDRLGQRVAKGEGMAPILEGRYGLNPAAGAYR